MPASTVAVPPAAAEVAARAKKIAQRFRAALARATKNVTAIQKRLARQLVAVEAAKVALEKAERNSVDSWETQDHAIHVRLTLRKNLKRDINSRIPFLTCLPLQPDKLTT